MQPIIIDTEFRDALPALKPESLAELEARIVAEGCRDPLVTWNGTLIDGHNRYAICTKNGVEFKAVAMSFADKDAAILWIKRTHLARRNLTPDQFKLMLGEIYNAEKGPANRMGTKKEPNQPRTRDRLAAEFGVSPQTVRRAGVIADEVRKMKTDDPAVSESEAIEKAKRVARVKEYKKETVNVSRTSAAAKDRRERVKVMAAEGYRAGQIAQELGIKESGVRSIALEHGITLPDSAKGSIGKSKRINPLRVIGETVSALEGLNMGLALIDDFDFSTVEKDQAATWAESLATSISSIRLLHKNLSRINP